MVVSAPPLLTVADLEGFPEDGKRREIIEGVLYVAAAPSRRHQRLLLHLTRLFIESVDESGWGQVYFAPVDVRFSERDQVQPDLLAIRRDRLHLYPRNTMHGAPDVVLEIFSPSNWAYDDVEKRALYERGEVPELWLVDPHEATIRVFRLTEERYVAVEPTNGLLRSTVVPELAVDGAALFAQVEREMAL